MGGQVPGRDEADDLSLWRQADAAFDRLLDAPPAQRAAAFEAMALPEPVRRRVERLLASDSRDGPLDDPARMLGALPGAADMPDMSDMPGRKIGDWTLGEEIGRGGMSVVYRAEREIGGSRQQAAVKVLTIGALAGHGRERFVREQGILARLDHPQIAGLLDVGVLEDGTPWMAMPRIEGVHIDRWCREHDSPLADIVRRMLAVCDAVAYAHGKLVVHRDIKPSNVLVDARGQVHLLDFGIARLIEDQREQATRTLAITPRFAAPEQIAGADAATSMDVYGLGALLFCLVTGEPPPEAHASGSHGDAPLASRHCASRPGSVARSRQLRGDLDAVLAKAMAADPTARYPGAAHLAADLRRWLDGRPVTAAARGRMYRARKFVGRHRWGVTTAATLLVTVLAATAISLWQAERARANAAQANAVKDFMVHIFEASGPDVAAGEDPAASELLKRGARRVRARFAKDPVLLGQVLGLIGSIEQERGLLADAEKSLDDALAAFEQAGKPSRAWADTLRARGAAWYDRAQFAKAAAAFQRADTVGVQAGLAPNDPLRLQIAIKRADAQVQDAKPQQAADALRALLPRMPPASADPDHLKAWALEVLGGALDSMGQPEKAIARLDQALALQKVHAGMPTLDCDILNDLGLAQFHAGRAADSTASLSRAIACARRYFGEYHQMTQAAMGNLAWVQARTGQAQEAANTYARLLPLIRRTVGNEPSSDVAYTLGMMALALDEAGQVDALVTMRKAWDESRKLGHADPSTGWVQPALGLLEFERGLPQAAEHLDAYRQSCNALDERSAVTRRVCIAQFFLALDEGHCLLPGGAAEPTTMTSGAQRPWLAGYWLVRQHCAPDATARSRAGSELHKSLDGLTPVPPWLERRLALQERKSSPPGP